MHASEYKVENIRAGPVRVKPGWTTWIALLALYSLAKLWFVADVELGKDEAVYWYWSQHLDASYALLPFSSFKLAHYLYPGHEWVLRLVQILVGASAIVLLYRLCRLHGLESPLSLWATAAFASSHWIWHATSYLHPDGFLVACWLLALIWARQSRGDADPVAHLKLGLAAGLAVLCKYSAAFLVLGLFIWILVTRERHQRWRALLWTLTTFSLVSSPLLYAQFKTLFYLPTTLSTLSQIADAHTPLIRLLFFLLNPLFFVSPLLLYLTYKVLIHKTGEALRQRPRETLLAVLPALCLLAGFAFFALARGQIKGNWILPAFLGLWPFAFKRANLPGRPRLFLLLAVLTGLLHALPIGISLKYPATFARLNESLESPLLDATYARLVSSPDLEREAAYSWTERLCEYSGWRGLATELDKTLEQKAVLPAVPLLSSQYGISFAMAYYGTGERPCLVVDDPRFRDLNDFHRQTGPDFPVAVIFVVRENFPLPASLQSLYPQSRLLAKLNRSASGCGTLMYHVFLLQRE